MGRDFGFFLLDISPIPLGLGEIEAFSVLKKRWFDGQLSVDGRCLFSRPILSRTWPMYGLGLWDFLLFISPIQLGLGGIGTFLMVWIIGGLIFGQLCFVGFGEV